MSTSIHYLPFPLPPYLSRFVASKLKSPIETLIDGSKVKAFHVRPVSHFGKLICRSLSPMNKPSKVTKAFTLYISVSSRSGSLDPKTPDMRTGFWGMREEDVQDIINIFEEHFYDCFYEYMDAKIEFYAEIGKRRGVVYKSINSFMHKYGQPDNPELFERLRKRYQRHEKNRSKTAFGA
jgi:hypothetical protein